MISRRQPSKMVSKRKTSPPKNPKQQQQPKTTKKTETGKTSRKGEASEKQLKVEEEEEEEPKLKPEEDFVGWLNQNKLTIDDVLNKTVIKSKSGSKTDYKEKINQSQCNFKLMTIY